MYTYWKREVVGQQWYWIIYIVESYPIQLATPLPRLGMEVINHVRLTAHTADHNYPTRLKVSSTSRRPTVTILCGRLSSSE